VILNAYWEPLAFELPAAPEGALGGWRRVLDTAQAAPDDFCAWQDAPVVDGPSYPAQPRSVVGLVARLAGYEAERFAG
jgi:glycogen operon protein